jgi:hypothetical protein
MDFNFIHTPQHRHTQSKVRFDIIFSPTGQISSIIIDGDKHRFSPNILLRLVGITIWAVSLTSLFQAANSACRASFLMDN